MHLKYLEYMSLKQLILILSLPFMGLFWGGGLLSIFIFGEKITATSVVPKIIGLILIPIVLVATIILFKRYFKFVLESLAEYWKARDLRKILKREGFKQK